MIDRLLLRIWFRPGYPALDDLGLRLHGEIDRTGSVSDLGHFWESIPSHFSKLAFRVFWDPSFGAQAPVDHRVSAWGTQMEFVPETIDPRSADEWRPYVELNASPAKLAQGHNVFGSDDLGDCALSLCDVFFRAYPQIADWLDFESCEVVLADVTYFARARNQREAEQFIQAMHQISKGQTRARTGYTTTAYFGKKNSRLRKLKCYLKLPEIVAEMERERDPMKRARMSRIFDDRMREFCDGMIRFEATVKSRWFHRRGLPTRLIDLVPVFSAPDIWSECWRDIASVLAGERVMIANDEEIEETLKAYYGQPVLRDGAPVLDRNGQPRMCYRRAHAVFRLYRAIRLSGWDEAKRTHPRSTWFRNVTFLSDATGISLAQLMSMGPGGTCNVVPLIRFLSVDFAEQFPAWHVAA